MNRTAAATATPETNCARFVDFWETPIFVTLKDPNGYQPRITMHDNALY